MYLHNSEVIANIELKSNTSYGHVKFHPHYDTVQDYIYEIGGDNEPGMLIHHLLMLTHALS